MDNGNFSLQWIGSLTILALRDVRVWTAKLRKQRQYPLQHLGRKIGRQSRRLLETLVAQNGSVNGPVVRLNKPRKAET